MERLFFLLFLSFFLVSCAGSRPQYRENSRARESSSCRELTTRDRIRILSLANPKNFVGARYKLGPRNPASIERATDCSHFVHQIYKRAGLPFPYNPTKTMANIPEFDVLPEEEAKPGDLMLFRGHVGIVDRGGKIISATKIRSRKQKSTVTRMDRDQFKDFRGERYVLRYRCKPSKSKGNLVRNP